MGRVSTSLLALGLGVLAALVLASCGSTSSAKLLPGKTAAEITHNLDEVKQLARSGECVGAQDAAQQVSDQIDALGGVDKNLKQALREGAARLNNVVSGCSEEETTETTEGGEETSESTATKPPKKEEKPSKPKPSAKPTPTPPAKTKPTPTPTSTTPTTSTPTTTSTPSTEGGGTGAPSGGVGVGSPVGGGH